MLICVLVYDMSVLDWVRSIWIFPLPCKSNIVVICHGAGANCSSCQPLLTLLKNKSWSQKFVWPYRHSCCSWTFMKIILEIEEWNSSCNESELNMLVFHESILLIFEMTTVAGTNSWSKVLSGTFCYYTRKKTFWPWPFPIPPVYSIM